MNTHPLAIIFSFVFGVCFAGLIGYRLVIRYVRLALDNPESFVAGALRPLTDAQLVRISTMLAGEMQRRHMLTQPPDSVPAVTS